MVAVALSLPLASRTTVVVSVVLGAGAGSVVSAAGSIQTALAVQKDWHVLQAHTESVPHTAYRIKRELHSGDWTLGSGEHHAPTPSLASAAHSMSNRRNLQALLQSLPHSPFTVHSAQDSSQMTPSQSRGDDDD